MVFSSNVFLLYFMPIFFLVYFILPKKVRNYFLLLASLVFYAWVAPEVTSSSPPLPTSTWCTG